MSAAVTNRATVHGLLDASMLCHVSYVIDGHPIARRPSSGGKTTSSIGTASSAKPHAREPVGGAAGVPDGRPISTAWCWHGCGFNHSADYRAVMAFGTAYIVTDPEEKARRAGRDGRPVLSGPHRFLAAKHQAGNQGKCCDRDGDRTGLRPSPHQGRADDDETMRCRFMPSAFRFAP